MSEDDFLRCPECDGMLISRTGYIDGVRGEYDECDQCGETFNFVKRGNYGAVRSDRQFDEGD